MGNVIHLPTQKREDTVEAKITVKGLANTTQRRIKFMESFIHECGTLCQSVRVYVKAWEDYYRSLGPHCFAHTSGVDEDGEYTEFIILKNK